MTDRPIIFSAPMVLALLAGRKTQTRRVIEPFAPAPFWPAPPKDEAPIPDIICVQVPAHLGGYVPGPSFKPKHKVGDRLWVRETWGIGCRPCPVHGWVDGVEYKADCTDDDAPPLHAIIPDDVEADGFSSGWRPSIYMPRWASRLTLIVTDIRVQRLQDISKEDAIAEGLERHGRFYGYPGADWDDGSPDAREAYAALWAKIHGPASWYANPWVCAISFRCLQGNIDRISSEVAR